VIQVLGDNSLLDKALEFVPLAGAIGIFVTVPILELPFRRFVFPFIWATLGCISARPVTNWVLDAAALDGRKPETLILFQSATVLTVFAIGIGEWARRARVPWRGLVASLGITSLPMTWLAFRVLNGFGPREYDLGPVGVWVAVVGYVTGPSALAALVFLLTVHRIELYEELGH
jgi:hypothetical protein